MLISSNYLTIVGRGEVRNMKKEYIDYALKLQPIGDLIIEISNLIDSNDAETLEKSVSRYEYASKELQSIVPPKVIKELSDQLNNALVVWIGTVKKMVVLGTDEEAKKQIAAQKNAETVIKNIIDEIVFTFQNN